MITIRVASLALVLAVVPTAAWAGSCTDPANFTPKQVIDTKFADFRVNQRAVFSDGEEQGTVTVLPAFVRSGGIWWRAVIDWSRTLEGSVLGEATVDLYAENKTGDVCYGGEVTAAFETGENVPDLAEISTEGSFVHGYDGERAGTYMVANPVVGQRWTIESIDGGALREEAQVTALSSSQVTIRISHYEDGQLVETETKVFDGNGELSASVPGEPVTRRTSFTPGG